MQAVAEQYCIHSFIHSNSLETSSLSTALYTHSGANHILSSELTVSYDNELAVAFDNTFKTVQLS